MHEFDEDSEIKTILGDSAGETFNLAALTSPNDTKQQEIFVVKKKEMEFYQYGKIIKKSNGADLLTIFFAGIGYACPPGTLLQVDISKDHP